MQARVSREPGQAMCLQQLDRCSSTGLDLAGATAEGLAWLAWLLACPSGGLFVGRAWGLRAN